MAQPSHIELQTGSDRGYRTAARTLWLLSAVVVMAQLQTLYWPLLLMASVLLFLLRPRTGDPDRRSCRLRLFRNGTALLGGQTGAWGRQTWCCRGYTILRVDLPSGTMRVLVCASRNTGDSYRSLRVWSRFLPFEADHQRRHSPSS